MKQNHTPRRGFRNVLRKAISPGTLVLVVALAVGFRILCQFLFGFPSVLANFSTIGAMALFGGAYYAKGKWGWLAFLIPIATVWISDWFVNLRDLGKFSPFYDGFYWQYLAYGLMVVLGALFLKRVRPIALIGTSLLGSIVFFLFSNFGVWASGAMVQYYTNDFHGLILCYIAGIPYFGGTILGDLFFSCVLFGAFELARSKFPAVAARPVTA